MPGISDVRKYEGTGYAGYKAPAYVAPKANDQEEESGGSGGGGGSPGWLQQAIQGPEWAAGVGYKGGREHGGTGVVPNWLSDTIPYGAGARGGSNDSGVGYISQTQGNQGGNGKGNANGQSPAWRFRGQGGQYDINDPIPAWQPTDWVNPSNPNPAVIPPVEPEPVMGGLTEANQPIGATIAAMNETRNPYTVLASYRMQHTTPGSPEYLDALAMYQASLPPTAGRPNSYSQGYLDKLNNPPAQTQPGVGMGDLRKFEATQAQTATGAIPPEEAAILQKYGIDPSTIKQVGAGSGKDASGNVINPWEKVQDPGTGVIHPRGLSLEEVINPTAANLTTGFDYRNNPGYKGMTVTMPDGTVLPQIAGYYIQNGRYFPIDLNAVSNMMKRYGGYSGGGGGGGNYGSGQKGWLASWNIGV